MKIHHPHGSKERLFEMMIRVNKLDEQEYSEDKRRVIVDDFINYVSEQLGLENIPEVELLYNEGIAQNMKSFGGYNPQTKKIVVVATNRNLADMLRTIAHELIHRKQDEEGILKSDSGETGSEEENEANAQAGVFMRDYSKNNPNIFE